MSRFDRLGEILEGVRHKRKTLETPEGVPLEVRIANRGERLAAFALDLVFMAAATFCLYLLFFLMLRSGVNLLAGITLTLFSAFLVRNLYFIHFELAWQGRTPGKRVCGLRVVNRSGGPLTPSAIIARNLTREVEAFLPLSLVFFSEMPRWQLMGLLSWAILVALLPLFSRDRLRLGDLIGGTQVIAMPRRILLNDLSLEAETASEGAYRFTSEQLAIYGAFELQVLEEFLRRPPSAETDRLLHEVCGKISRKIGWDENIPQQRIRQFLNDFYVAERAELERAQLFGRPREEKESVPASPRVREISDGAPPVEPTR